MKRIAVTGGIAEGKSTVLGYLRDAGYRVASADEFAKAVFNSPEVQEKLAQLLRIPEPIPPASVRERLVDPQVRRAVNRLTHPKILARIRSSAAQFVEVPLLIEACLQAEFDRVWVVTCGAQEQLRRLTERLGEQASAEALLRAQLPTRAKIAFADDVFRTNDSEETVRRIASLAAKREFA